MRTGSSQTPIRMYSRDPGNGQQAWSLLSSYVPRNKSNLSASSPPTPTRRRPTTAGSWSRAAQRERARPDAGLQQPDLRPQITRKTQKFKLSDATTQYGSVVSVPLSSGLMYVVPVYATRSQSDASSYLTLRYVMVQYGPTVGIGNTLVDAITDMAGSAPPDPNHPRAEPETHPGRPGEGTRAAPEGPGRLRRRRPRSSEGGGRSGSLSHQARVEVARALNLLQ